MAPFTGHSRRVPGFAAFKNVPSHHLSMDTSSDAKKLKKKTLWVWLRHTKIKGVKLGRGFSLSCKAMDPAGFDPMALK